MDLFVGTGGVIGLTLHANVTGQTECRDIVGGPSSCGAWTSAAPVLGPAASCFVPNPAGGGSGPEAYPSSVPLYNTSETKGTPLSMPVLATSTYVYGRTTHTGLPDGNGVWRETEYALYGSLDGSPLPEVGEDACEPATCAQLGTQCGTTDDGCGGVVQCGSCAYPYLCGEGSCELPANCNLQQCGPGATVAQTCCSPGRMTCPNGTGCTCYDACS